MEQTDLLDALDVPPAADPAKRWLTLAEASGLALVKACRDPEAPDRTRATAIGLIARRLWPSHEWDERDVEQVLRLLCAVVGCTGEGASDTGSALPRFRLHTFFKSPEGLYASVVPLVRAARYRGHSLARAAFAQPFRVGGWSRSATSGTSQVRRQFELLHCECCGETFLGGDPSPRRRSGKSRARTKWRNCCPMRPTQSVCRINRLRSASKSSATRITQLSGRKDDNPGPEDRSRQQRDLAKWVWLDPVSGILHLT